MLAGSMWDEPPIAVQYNCAVQTYLTKVGSWDGRRKRRAQHILRCYWSHCDGLLALRDLVEELMPEHVHLFDGQYGQRPALLPLPFSDRSEAKAAGLEPHIRVNADGRPGTCADVEAVLDRFDEHLERLSAESAIFVTWMKTQPWHEGFARKLGLDPSWKFCYRPEWFRGIWWRQCLLESSDKAATLAEGFGIQAASIWETVNAPAIRYNMSVGRYRDLAHLWNQEQLDAAKRMLSHYRSFCQGQLALRELAQQLLPRYESFFEKGYGQHAELKPLPFS
jgi:hypothetical protein